jgi:CelD/BcsL family acetyltransferase involved in cellulose biosynthesis
MHVHVVRPEELSTAQLALWSAIQAADPALASPYLCPEFTQAVGRVRRDAFVAVLEQDGAMVGFLPFQRRRNGVGWPIGGPLSDVQAVIARPGLVLEPDRLLRGCKLAALDFSNLLASQAAFAPWHRQVEPSHCVDLAAGFAAYAAERRQAGSVVLSQTEAKARKLEKAFGPLRFALHAPDPALLRTLLAWKRAQYRRTRVVDAFAFAWTVGLLEGLATTETGGFAGVLSALWAGDRLMALHFGLRSRRIWHYWFPTYDAEHARHSPGAVLLLRMIQRAHELGVAMIELTKGDYLFKQRFANAAIPVATAFVGRPSFASAARRLRGGLEAVCERLPIGRFRTWPGKALRRLDAHLAFR